MIQKNIWVRVWARHTFEDHVICTYLWLYEQFIERSMDRMVAGSRYHQVQSFWDKVTKNDSESSIVRSTRMTWLSISSVPTPGISSEIFYVISNFGQPSIYMVSYHRLRLLGTVWHWVVFVCDNDDDNDDDDGDDISAHPGDIGSSLMGEGGCGATAPFIGLAWFQWSCVSLSLKIFLTQLKNFNTTKAIWDGW